jgi:pantoate--beta-alanine ligase
MIIFKKANQLTEYLNKEKNTGKKTGFVPTMGALHDGHISLVTASKKANDITVCSIFVNPTQFNNPEDFKHYPITIEKDINLLVNGGCDVLFLPSVDEIYPPSYQKKHYELGRLEEILEGKYRQGHFQGVCQVVERLLNIVQPHNLYIGQKDFQQCMVIKRLVQLMGKTNDLVINIIPTIRENDGLAMSSRNLRLNVKQRKDASQIYQELIIIKNHLKDQPLDLLKEAAKEHLIHHGFVVDYVEIAQSNDLAPLENVKEPSIALIAASLDNIRLIDNLLLN